MFHPRRKCPGENEEEPGRSTVISIELVLQAYQQGWFPMGDDKSPGIEWYSPDPRGIIPLDTFHVPTRLQRVIRQERFTIRINTAFDEVIRTCAARGETWITRDIIDTYSELHRLGFAHSVEAWAGDELAGGLYGVGLRGVFFGESMFHRATDASKVALAALVDRLRARGYLLLDTQWVTPHLLQFGAIEIPRVRYLRMLTRALDRACTFRD
jgi:leucyl/phenylalanyl-tRNA--protein transferase